MAGRQSRTVAVEKIQYSFVPNHRDTMEALAHARFSNQEFRLIISLLNQTNGYLREEDRLSLAFWSRLTGMSRQHLCHTIRRLVDKKVISRNGDSYRVNRPAQWTPEMLKTLPKGATELKRGGRPSKEKVLPLQATQPRGEGPLPAEAILPEQAKSIAQAGNTSLPVRATPPDTNQIGHKENYKENSIKKGLNPRAPSRSRGNTPSNGSKPFQNEAGAFLDWIGSREKIQFPNRGKLMNLVRRTLAATKANWEELQEWYCWVKENDPYWGAREPPVIIAQGPEKFPTWLRDRKEGRLHGQRQGLRERGRHPGQARTPFRSVTAADLESGRARFEGQRVVWADEEGDQD